MCCGGVCKRRGCFGECVLRLLADVGADDSNRVSGRSSHVAKLRSEFDAGKFCRNYLDRG